jgi:HSP20 family protein
MNAIAEQDTQAAAPAPAATVQNAREYVSPVVNIWETPEAYVLEAEMPGVNKSGLSVSVENRVLTLVGHRSPPATARPLYLETRAADFRRVFELDPLIETERITAQIERGVLTLTLPKAEQAKPRQIAVN